MVTAIAAYFALASQANQTPSDVFESYGLTVVKTSQATYAIESPQTVAEGSPIGVDVSPSGNKLAIFHHNFSTLDVLSGKVTEAEAGSQLVTIWDSKDNSKRTTEIEAKGRIAGLGWFSEEKTALLRIINGEKQEVIHVNFVTGVQKVVYETLPESRIDIAYSHTNYAALMASKSTAEIPATVQTEIIVIDSQGRSTTRMSLNNQSFSTLRFDSQGMGLVASRNDEKSNTAAWYSLDFPSQSAKRLNAKPSISEAKISFEPLVRTTAMQESGESFATLSWHFPGTEESSSPTVYVPVAMNSEEGGILLSHGYLFYVQSNGVAVRRINKISDDTYHQLKKLIVQNETMSHAKMVGTAIAIYLANNDGVLPSAKNFKDDVLPYILNSSWFDGFDYYLNGENFDSIENPSEKMMGAINTAYGQAIVYADGSVKWHEVKQS